MTVARRTTPYEGTPSERFSTYRGFEDTLWTRLVVSANQMKSVRTAARQFLVANAVSETYADDIVLTLSELLSNGLASGQPGGTVTAELNCLHPNLVKLTVMNQGTLESAREFLPAITGMPGPEIDRGRGLPLVAALATRVAIDAMPSTTRVQADFLR
jgi:anti-sigma regulatory factor (Ser/Thr protein kinase)